LSLSALLPRNERARTNGIPLSSRCRSDIGTPARTVRIGVPVDGEVGTSEARWAKADDVTCSLLDAFAEGSAVRRRLARTGQRDRIESILARSSAEIEGTLEEGDNDG
jgi:hypothetical protein